MHFHTIGRAAALALVATAWSAAAPAQDTEESEAPRRTRVALGPQLVPSYPGSDKYSVRPLVDVARARGDDPFMFEAPDESFGFSLFRTDTFAIGPVAGFEGSRKAKDVGAAVPKVDFTFELGAFVEAQLAEPFRIRAEARRGLGGHKGWIAVVSADYVARDADNWLFSIGPRVTFGNDRYHQAYFGVSPAASATSGLPAFSADGGLQAVGATAGFIRQLTPRWGIYSYAKYDRLVDDAGRSPLVRQFGSRDQFSGGLALTYTFGSGVSGSR
jgi:outer membrane protein